MRAALPALALAFACGSSGSPSSGSGSGSALPPAPPPVAGQPVSPGALTALGEPSQFSVIAPRGTNLHVLEEAARFAISGLPIELHDVSAAEAGLTAEALGAGAGALPPAEIAQITGSPGVLILSTSATGIDSLHRLATIAHDLAASVHGWAVDNRLGRFYTPNQLAAQMPTPPLDVRKLITIEVRPRDDAAGVGSDLSLLTAGMRRLGVPDLYIPSVGGDEVTAAASVLNATAQLLAARGGVTATGELALDVGALDPSFHADDIHAAGGTGKIAWRALWRRMGTGAGSDAFAYAIELDAPAGSDSAKLAASLDQFFGSDSEMSAAAAHARGELAALAPSFANGIAANERLAVRAEVHADNGSGEWTWITVDAITPAQITATLGGSAVTIPFEAISDFKYTRSDGKTVSGR